MNIRKKKSFWSIFWSMYRSDILFILTILALIAGFIGLVWVNSFFYDNIFSAATLAAIEIVVVVILYSAIKNTICNICIIKRFTYLPITEDELKESGIYSENNSETVANWWYFLLNNISFSEDCTIWEGVLVEIAVRFDELANTIGRMKGLPSYRTINVSFSNDDMKRLIEMIDSASCKGEAIKNIAQDWHAKTVIRESKD